SVLQLGLMEHVEGQGPLARCPGMAIVGQTPRDHGIAWPEKLQRHVEKTPYQVRTAQVILGCRQRPEAVIACPAVELADHDAQPESPYLVHELTQFRAVEAPSQAQMTLHVQAVDRQT